MSDIRMEMLDTVTQLRLHLELQRALGVTFLGPFSGGIPVDASPAGVVSDAEDARTSTTGAETSELDALREEVRACRRCGLSGSRKQVVFGEGKPSASVVFVGTAPAKEGDEQGSPFAGPDGQLLSDIIVKGMKLERAEVYVCTLLKCRLQNGDPEAREIEACENFLTRQLRAVGPKIVVALGPVVTRTLLKGTEEFGEIRGKWHEYQGIRVMPTFEPAHLLKKPADKKLVWEDIKKVMAGMEKLK